MEEKAFINYILSKSVKQIEFTAKELPLFDKYVVYMATSESECLYIGMSTKGLSRVFGKGHHVLANIYREIKNIQVYETRTEKDARELESMMIQEFSPKYNNRLYTDGIRSIWRQKGKGISAIIDNYPAYC